MLIIICCMLAYLIGSLSSAIIVCKIFRLPDPRQKGSMNPGATNVLRLGGKKAAIITLAGDVLKGFIPVITAKMLGFTDLLVGCVALFAFLGHLFPIFFKFQGGKGVATALGTYLALSPLVGIIVIIFWLITAIVSRYSSFSSLVASIAAPILLLIFSNLGYCIPILVMTGILIWRHRKNIERLRTNTESKIKI